MAYYKQLSNDIITNMVNDTPTFNQFNMYQFDKLTQYLIDYMAQNNLLDITRYDLYETKDIVLMTWCQLLIEFGLYHITLQQLGGIEKYFQNKINNYATKTR